MNYHLGFKELSSDIQIIVLIFNNFSVLVNFHCFHCVVSIKISLRHQIGDKSVNILEHLASGVGKTPKNKLKKTELTESQY